MKNNDQRPGIPQQASKEEFEKAIAEQKHPLKSQPHDQVSTSALQEKRQTISEKREQTKQDLMKIMINQEEKPDSMKKEQTLNQSEENKPLDNIQERESKQQSPEIKEIQANQENDRKRGTGDWPGMKWIGQRKWVIGLFVGIIILVVFFSLGGLSILIPKEPLHLNKDVMVKDQFIVRLADYVQDRSSAKLSIFVRPTSNRENRYKDTLGFSYYLNEKPVIQMRIRIEDRFGNAICQADTSKANHFTAVDQGQTWEQFEWTDLPKGGRIFVIEQISEFMVTEGLIQNSSGKQVVSGEEKVYPMNEYFSLPEPEILDHGLMMARELKKLTSQGKVYGVPFKIDTPVSMIEKILGPPASDANLNFWMKNELDLLIINDDRKTSCTEYKLGKRNPSHDLRSFIDLPKRYQGMTMEHVKKVFGNQYIDHTFRDINGRSLNGADRFLYKLSPYEIEFWVKKGRIVTIAVSQEGCMTFK
ncbi:DUF4309 domain-containing protein [Thermoflavimicrobium dichotomicum]|uniref:Uncharacterized protein n=1 Tax=Thermoflavimicrobium dichotomicum TaxID=46223 RepID=A0A1I3MRE9_9BACL|nr:DUF4309 domain-containing protein [Thermoflavimicrobium dichotomicum]SFI99522.1 protein of unknown function [Thermoflavimicrobium dichotomicum]